MTNLRLLFLTSFVLLSSPAFAVTRTICASGCDHTTIASAEAAAGANDILEIRGNETFLERWTPGGARTLQVASGFVAVVGKISGSNRGAADLSSAGVGPVSILGILGEEGSLTLQTGGTSNEIVLHKSGGNAIVFVAKNFATSHSGGGTCSFDFTDTTANRDYTLDGIDLNGNSVSNADGVNYTTSSGSSLIVLNSVFNNLTSDCILITGSQTAITAKIINSTFGDCTGIALLADDPVSLINNVFSSDVTDDISLTSPAVVSDFIFNNFEEESIAGMPASNTDNVVTFIDASADNYRVNNGSPAIDAGTTSDTIIDFDGTSRPQGPSYDQGFHEAIPAAASGVKKGSLGLLGVGL